MRRMLTLAAATALLTACASAPESADPVDLEANQSSTTDDDTGSSASAPDEDATTEEDPDEQEDADGPSGTTVDTATAEPGTWPVGDAGTVTFSLVDGALVLDDVTTEDGWTAEVDEADPDEIEVDLHRGNVEWEIEIELEDRGTILQIEIDQDIADAEPGTYEIGDAGTFAFEVSDGQLVLTDLTLVEDWTLAERNEAADEVELEVVNGPRSFDIDIELASDGTIDVEIDYEVTGPVGG